MLRPCRFLCVGPSRPHFADRPPGFTLIEMVIVMAVLGLLLTLAVPRYFTALDNGKATVQQQNLATMRDALDKFFGDKGRYPESLEELVQKRYLRSVPVDPITGASDWIAIAPPDPAMSGVYDVRSAAEANNESSATN